MIDNKETQVCIQKNTYNEIDISSLLKPIGGIKKYIKKNERVLLKTNLLNATEPEKVVVTNPLVIEAVAKEIQKNGGIPFIADSPSGPFTKRRLKKVYKKSGLLKLSEKTGIELNYNTKNKKIEIPNAKKLKNVPICNFFLEADKTIAIPKIKTHSLMIMSLATKIMYGVIPGLTKAAYHAKYIRRKDFADMLIDLLTITTPDLIIMDGITAMEGEGPMSGTPKKTNVLLASENPIAIDLAVCQMLNIEPTGIPTLKQAKIRKMYPKKIKYPILKPDQNKIKDFQLPSTTGHILSDKKQPNKHPVITDNCVACKECVNICPKKAIKIEKNKAKINYNKCIKCYCCHEVCTYNAIKLETIQ